MEEESREGCNLIFEDEEDARLFFAFLKANKEAEIRQRKFEAHLKEFIGYYRLHNWVNEAILFELLEMDSKALFCELSSTINKAVFDRSIIDRCKKFAETYEKHHEKITGENAGRRLRNFYAIAIKSERDEQLKAEWKEEKKTFTDYLSKNNYKGRDEICNPEKIIELNYIGESKNVKEEKDEPLVTPTLQLQCVTVNFPPEKYPSMYFFDRKGKVLGLTPVENRTARSKATTEFANRSHQ